MATAMNGNCDIFYETFGDSADPTLLLVNGLGSQCVNYHENWCAMFVARGLHVVRYDNRDVGLSTKFDDAPTGGRGEAYSISDMAADGMAVLDALGVERANVMGLSMGGMIVQTMAIEHADRLLSMTSVMSRTGERGYGEPTAEAFALLTGPSPTDRPSHADNWVAGQRVWGSPAFADETRWRSAAERSFKRCFHPSGTTRQYKAILASPPRAEALRSITTPTLVIHGDCDTLIDISGGRRTAELIAGARFEVIEGMGHDYPPELWQRWVDLVTNFVAGIPSPR
jgi:pimeloyl-ACP methyl ester carboxylesterase